MIGRLLLAGALSLGALSASGCAAFDSLSLFAKDNYVDEDDPTEMVDEKWTESVRTEGRGDRSVEVDPDGWWWGKYIQSAKGREIERNLGIDHGI